MSDVNTVDVQLDGSRFRFLSDWPCATPVDYDKLIPVVLQDWGVVTTFDIDQYENGAPSECTSVTVRRYMLQFPDGLWRYGEFGGHGGGVSARCSNKFWYGETGEIGYLKYRFDLVTNTIEFHNRELTKLNQAGLNLLAKLGAAASRLPTASGDGREKGG